MRIVLLLFVLISPLIGGNIRIDIHHQYEGKPLLLNSIRYGKSETFSISRLSYLLSSFAFQSDDGEWHELPDQYAYLDAGKRRTSFSLANVPAGTYRAARFSVGIPKKTNHEKPNQYADDHPLNPNLNQLHWDWKTGYINPLSPPCIPPKFVLHGLSSKSKFLAIPWTGAAVGERGLAARSRVF